jgi:hypothetical protein
MTMPTIEWGQEEPLGQMREGTPKVSLPQNSVLTSLRLGKEKKNGPRWLDVRYKTGHVEGGRPLVLGEENQLPTIIAPHNSGSSGRIDVPAEGNIVSALQLGGQALSVWYRKVETPVNFKLGPDKKDGWTTEPADNGAGTIAAMDGYTITGFSWQKDPDGQLHIHIWYTQLPVSA